MHLSAETGEGETTDDLFGFLTTEANREVGAIHPKAMPVIRTQPDELDVWMNARSQKLCAFSGLSLWPSRRTFLGDPIQDQKKSGQPVG